MKAAQPELLVHWLAVEGAKALTTEASPQLVQYKVWLRPTHGMIASARTRNVFFMSVKEWN